MGLVLFIVLRGCFLALFIICRGRTSPPSQPLVEEESGHDDIYVPNNAVAQAAASAQAEDIIANWASEQAAAVEEARRADQERLRVLGQQIAGSQELQEGGALRASGSHMEALRESEG